jgi:tetratricopeptide (TPR) repeat protein
MMRNSWLVVLIALLALVVTSSQVGAVGEARVRGAITDTQGNPIVGVELLITCPERGDYKKSVKIKKDGSYSVLLIDATKTYYFKVTAPDFVDHEKSVKVGVGSMDNTYNFKLIRIEEQKQQMQQKISELPGYKEYSEGRDLFMAGKIEEAEAKLVEAVAIVPDLYNGWLALTRISFEQEEWAEALERAGKCLELKAESADCLAVASNSAKELGNEAAYNEYFARYQALNPEDPATLFNKAAELLNKMDDAQAKPLLERCLEVDPEFGACIFEYGMVLLRTGDMAGAKKQLERYLEVAPDGEHAATAADTIKYL